jgi:hypothetical protein
MIRTISHMPGAGGFWGRLGEFEMKAALGNIGNHEVGATDRVQRLQRFAPFELMRFRLTYTGELKAAGNGGGRRRADEKWEIRKAIAPQLVRLWATHPALKGIGFHVETDPDRGVVLRQPPLESHLSDPYYVLTGSPDATVRIQEVDEVAKALECPIMRGGKPFLPLVTKVLNLRCTLDILFMHQGHGQLVHQGGDIDNRIKTLFDALSLPHDQETCPDDITPAGAFPCLLEDDSLIQGFSVTPDRLLTNNPLNPSTVHLVIQATVSVVRLTELNIGFLGD